MSNIWRRNFIFGSTSAAAFSLAGYSDAAGAAGANWVRSEILGRVKASPAMSANALAPTGAAVTADPAQPLGNPQVAANSRRNYVFGPKGPSSMVGFANVGVGENVLGETTTGSWNTAVGDLVMPRHKDGINNVGVGALALFSSISAIDCTAVGVEALVSVVDGVGATAVGRLACSTLVSAGNNTGIGDSALRFLESGFGNTALGYTSAENVIRGSSNTFAGAQAAKSMPQGDYNTVLGAHAMMSAGTGNDNVAVGAMAMLETTGSSNVAVGMRAGSLALNATRSVFVGGLSGAATKQAQNVDNVIAIGHGAVATKNNQLVLGNDETQEIVIGGVVMSKAELLMLLQMIRRR